MKKVNSQIVSLKKELENIENAHAQSVVAKERKWADDLTELDERARTLVKRRDKEIEQLKQEVKRQVKRREEKQRV